MVPMLRGWFWHALATHLGTCNIFYLKRFWPHPQIAFSVQHMFYCHEMYYRFIDFPSIVSSFFLFETPKFGGYLHQRNPFWCHVWDGQTISACLGISDNSGYPRSSSILDRDVPFKKNNHSWGYAPFPSWNPPSSTHILDTTKCRILPKKIPYITPPFSSDWGPGWPLRHSLWPLHWFQRIWDGARRPATRRRGRCGGFHIVMGDPQELDGL